MGVCQSQTGVKTDDPNSRSGVNDGSNTPSPLGLLKTIVLMNLLRVQKGKKGGFEMGNSEITSIDQLKFEKRSFITKGNEKFRDNYIIGQ